MTQCTLQHPLISGENRGNLLAPGMVFSSNAILGQPNGKLMSAVELH